MSGFLGQTKKLENVPGDIVGPRGDLSNFISNQGFDPLMTGTPDITPYMKMFAQQNQVNNARAIEQSGNLTGSGYANTLGASVARGNVEQGAFLASLLEKSRQENANRYAGIVNSFLNQGVSSPTYAYQPGLFDYAAQAGSSLAAGGAFNNLFPGTKKQATG